MLSVVEPSPEDDYRGLKARVGNILPADSSGRRRPPDRDSVRVYWEIGRLLNEHISGRAVYGQRAVARLAEDLGVLPRTLYRARKLHQRLPSDTPALQHLTWSHCRLLVTVPDDDELHRLMTSAATEGWSVRRLQDHLRGEARESVPVPRGRPDTYRIVELVDGGKDQVLAFDLGFGVRRGLDALGRVGKRTRRLLEELSPGDVVERIRDDKDRPALRRVWGQVGTRLFTYRACLLEARATGVVKAEVDLGFDVSWVCGLHLRGDAGRLQKGQLQQRLAAAPAPVVVKTHRLRNGIEYEADVYGQHGEREPRLIAERGEYLNDAWVGEAGP